MITLDGRAYDVRVLRRVTRPPEAPRLIVVSYLPNTLCRETLRVCVAAVQRYTTTPHELWIVDNHSPKNAVDWLQTLAGVNLVLNRTEPLPREGRGFWNRVYHQFDQRRWASYANAVGLELGVRVIDTTTRHLFTMHMDAAPCRENWLAFLRSKLSNRVAAAGVRMDRQRTPEGVLHILGCLFDFQILRGLNVDFFPDLPRYDVGDLASVRLREAGYELFACRNTIHAPELAETLPAANPLRDLRADRAFDDEGNVVYLHVGRGVRKATGDVTQGMSAETWVRFVDEHVLR